MMIQNGSRRKKIGSQKLADVEFVDDVALITETIKGARRLLDSLKNAVWSVVLESCWKRFTTLLTLEHGYLATTEREI